MPPAFAKGYGVVVVDFELPSFLLKLTL